MSKNELADLRWIFGGIKWSRSNACRVCPFLGISIYQYMYFAAIFTKVSYK